MFLSKFKNIKTSKQWLYWASSSYSHSQEREDTSQFIISTYNISSFPYLHPIQSCSYGFHFNCLQLVLGGLILEAGRQGLVRGRIKAGVDCHLLSLDMQDHDGTLRKNKQKHRRKNCQAVFEGLESLTRKSCWEKIAATETRVILSIFPAVLFSRV